MPVIPRSNVSQATSRGGVTGFRVGATGAGAVGQASENLGRQLSSFGHEAFDINESFSARKADREATTAASTLTRFKTSLLHQPEGGLMNLQGASAEGATDRAREDLDNIVIDLSKGMDGRTKALFDQMVLSEIDSAFTSVSMHESSQLQAAGSHARNEDVLATSASIASDYTGVQLDVRLAELQSKVESGAFADGIRDPEIVEIQVGQVIGQTLAVRAQNAIENGALDTAESILQNHGDRMDPVSELALDTLITNRRVMDAADDGALVAVRVANAQTKTSAREIALASATAALEARGIEMTRERATAIKEVADAEFELRENDGNRMVSAAAARSVTSFELAITANNQGQSSTREVAAAFQKSIAELSGGRTPGELATVRRMYDNWRENPRGNGSATINDQEALQSSIAITDGELALMSEVALKMKFQSVLTDTAYGSLLSRWQNVQSSAQNSSVKAGQLSSSEVNRQIYTQLGAHNLLRSNDSIGKLGPEDSTVLNATNQLILDKMGDDLSQNSLDSALSSTMFDAVLSRTNVFGRNVTVTEAEVIKEPTLLEDYDPELWRVLTASAGGDVKLINDRSWLRLQVKKLFSAKNRKDLEAASASALSEGKFTQ